MHYLVRCPQIKKVNNTKQTLGYFGGDFYKGEIREGFH